MRAIAYRLGVRAQSLYTHIHSREDLLDAVADHIVNEIDADPATRHHLSDPWQAQLTDTAYAARRCARRHPHAFVLIATRPPPPPRTPPHLLAPRWVTHIQNTLTYSGFDRDDVAFAIHAFDAFLLGTLLMETRTLANDAAATPPTHPPTGSPSTPQPRRRHRQISDLTRQLDKTFSTDLADVIRRITSTTSHSHPVTATPTRPN